MKKNTKINKTAEDLNRKIAVVGGGVSGLYLADGLVKRGYKHVTLYEKDSRLGGKLHTIFITINLMKWVLYFRCLHKNI